MTEDTKAGPADHEPRQDEDTSDSTSPDEPGEEQEQPSWLCVRLPFREPQSFTLQVALVEIDGYTGYRLGDRPLPFVADPNGDDRFDLSGVLPLDRGIERKVALAVARATSEHHAAHGDWMHPWCEGCELRYYRWEDGPYFATYAGISDAELRDDLTTVCRARVRADLLTPAMPEPAKITRSRGPLRALTHAELGARAAVQWVISNLVPARSVGIIYGPSGSLKSFAALDLLAHIASGSEKYHGHDVGTWSPEDENGDQHELYQPSDHPVLYVPGEGRDGTVERLTAFGDRYLDGETVDRLHIADWMPDLSTEEGFEQLAALAEEHRYSVVVLDTLRKAAGGSDENSASERGALIDRLYRLAEITQGTVIAVAHSGLDGGRIRGSSAQYADVDFVIEVERDGMDLTLTVRKQKDGRDDLEIMLTAQPQGSSLVLVDHSALAGGEVTWSSNRLADALYGFAKSQTEAGIGPVTQGDLIALGKDQHEAGRTKVQDTLADLCKQGYLTPDGAKGRPKTYTPGPRSWPSQRVSE